MPMLDNGQNPVPTESGAMRSALGNRDLDDSEIEVLAREWDKFEEHDEELYEFEARDGSHNWEAREWNDWEERGWDQWDARDWEGQYAL
ncbi:hypothetical protein BDQ17DRAFT_1364826 [Cyathus striatus]|nr:hypothetical protein BDQ17DRAFT_1372802 [Cyathus striatus]KAF8996162.1 hypothetical protein BDQ17DRAFT_1364826 [Cyathus striatus]